jgi:hypothetical protein
MIVEVMHDLVKNAFILCFSLLLIITLLNILFELLSREK